jgi:AraC-like DNA-binding protein
VTQAAADDHTRDQGQPEARMSIGLLRPVFRALIALGCEYRSLLAAEGLTPAELNSAEQRVPHSTALRLLDAALAASGDPAFGLVAAAHADHADLGMIGQLIATAPTVAEGLARTARFSRLLHDAAEVTGELRENRFVWQSTMRGVAMPPLAIEALAGGTIARMRSRLGLEWAPLEMWFPYPAPPYVAAYERFFRCALRFDMPAAGTVIDAQVLGWTSPVDRSISELIERRAESALERLDGGDRCTDRVRDVLAAGLAQGELGADTVARALHMSRATLTRRLAAEGSSVTAVLDALRRDLALEYIRDSALSLEELARRLAFSDARALRRAFQRWTGKTPAELRRKPEG